MSDQRFSADLVVTAHDLLDDHSLQSTHSIYTWWLGVRPAFKAFWDVVRKVENGVGVRGGENGE